MPAQLPNQINQMQLQQLQKLKQQQMLLPQSLLFRNALPDGVIHGSDPRNDTHFGAKLIWRIGELRSIHEDSLPTRSPADELGWFSINPFWNDRNQPKQNQERKAQKLLLCYARAPTLSQLLPVLKWQAKVENSVRCLMYLPLCKAGFDSSFRK
ncbi:hypothetical protein HPP92_018326 [Vanilla planifolia]|uniref:Uncharacterized protein n=1 Tax=Vanilla planifolia TaxID=51239 RepID=A0A835Q5I3_VANPL|nr:hypothetical protein HPP92_018326 [Vanilla planifolia]